jgi:hypothetical protein
MPNTRREARAFDQCDIHNPLRAEYDLDQVDGFVVLGSLKHEVATARAPQFSVDPGSAFRFTVKSKPEASVAAAPQAGYDFIVKDTVLRTMAGSEGNPIALKETMTLWSENLKPVVATVHASVTLFRSGSPRPSVQIKVEPSLDLSGEIPGDGYVKIGEINLTPSESAQIKYRQDANFIAHIQLRDHNGKDMRACVRRWRFEAAENDRIWVDDGIDDHLDLNAEENRFLTNKFEIGVSLADLRRCLRSSAGTNPNGSTHLELTITTRLSTDKGPEVPGEPRRIEVCGMPMDSVVFSGLCGMRPKRLALPPNDGDIHFDFPPLRVRLDPQGIISDPVELQVAADGAPLLIKLTSEIIGTERSWSLPVETSNVSDPKGQSFRISVDNLLAKARSAGALVDNVEFRISAHASLADQDGAKEVKVVFHSRVSIERDPPDWLICIDFGTSSTALWIGPNGTFDIGHQLRLGDWLSRIDPLHSESAFWTRSDDASDTDSNISFLLPSHIGLSSEINLRADYDPLSLGDLSLALPGPKAAEKKLAALKRTYDVSVPFPSSVLMPSFVGSVITEPKRKLMMRSEHVVMGAEVLEMKGAKPALVRRVDLGKVVEDCFDELGGYIASGALNHDDIVSPSKLISDIRQARIDPNVRFGVVVTHPSGIDKTRREIYRRAGRRFIEAFCGPGFDSHSDVMLVAEALAAARYGIDDYLSGKPAEDRSESFVTLDVGGGTYDVTVIKANSEKASRWDVVSHFGLAVGGSDLDEALLRCVIKVLEIARKDPTVTDAFEIPVGLDNTAPHAAGFRARLTLAMQFQAAKGRLTRLLLNDARERYAWPRKADSGPPLEILVYDPADTQTEWPVSAAGRAKVVREIPNTSATLSFEPTPKGFAVRLRMWRDDFDERATAKDNTLFTLTELMGVELPRIALTKAAQSKGSPMVIVTGRAALWPPLYEKIEKTVEAAGESGAKMVRSKPFPPDEMKHAVVVGAVNVARETAGQLNSEATLDNPVALITFKINVRSRRSGGGTGRVIDDIILLADDNGPSGTTSVEIDGPFIIARIMPGLDIVEGRERRLKLFDDLYRINRVKPFFELTRELSNPLPGKVGPQKWTVKWHRDLSGLRLTFDCGAKKSIEFGPFSGGRIYGPS